MKKALPIIILICILIVAIPIYGKAPLTDGVDLANVNKNERGEGYVWDNRNSILTLNNFNVDTSGEFGLRLPADSVVIIEGNNTIKAAKSGVICIGTTIIKGTGTLDIVSDEVGILNNSTDILTKVTILDGNINIQAGVEGIRSKNTHFIIAGGKIDITTTGDTGNAIYGYSLRLSGADITANNSIVSGTSLTINALNLTVTSDKKALQSVKPLETENVDVSFGSNENSVTVKSTWKPAATSAILGDNYPAYLDGILVIGTVLIIAAVITVPVIIHKQKVKKIEMRIAAEKKAAKIKK